MANNTKPAALTAAGFCIFEQVYFEQAYKARQRTPVSSVFSPVSTRSA